MTTDGIPPSSLSNPDLLRELESAHNSRFTTLRHGSDSALAEHTHRTQLLEAEYLRRFPEREVDPNRRRPPESVDLRGPVPGGQPGAPRSVANRARRKSAGSAVEAVAPPLSADVVELANRQVVGPEQGAQPPT